MIQHIVLLKFEENTPKEHLEEFRKVLYALMPAIPQIKSLDVGIDELAESRSWHVALLMTFENVEDLRTYQQHPEHIKAIEFNQEYQTEIAVVDYTLS